MAWHAQPSGGYYSGGSTISQDALDNMLMVRSYLGGFDINAVCGMLGNMAAESGLNPWRWQSDTYNLSNGYGLMQFTPASGYINLTGIPNHSPNMSTSVQTAGATPEDGDAQLYVFVNDTLGKWVNTCWRSYWSPTTYPALYSQHTHILNTYGSGISLSLAQFGQIDNLADATFAFLACYEGPAVPNYTTRLDNAQHIYNAISGGGGNLPKWLIGYASQQWRRRL